MSKKKHEKKLLTRIKEKLKNRKTRTSSMPFMGSSMFGGGSEKPPKGFRALSMLQATIEFSAPIMELIDNADIEALNKAMQIGTEMWNFTNPQVPAPIKKSRQDIVNDISENLKMTQQESEDFFDRMLERKAYLFPDEIQPQRGMTKFMRKEVEYLIAQFDENRLHLSEEAIAADKEDQPMLAAIDKMDKYIKQGAPYEDWEAHFYSMQEMCRMRYYEWLKAKGANEEDSAELASCLDLYLTFLYEYGNGEIRKVSGPEIEEFFMDFLMRKIMVDPPEYAYWPPAVRLFYTFLFEKGYLKNADRQRQLFNKIEPDFIQYLKERS